MQRTRRNMNVVYNTSENFIMNLSLDFTHTVQDVERSIRYHSGLRAKISDPRPAHCSEHILTLCARERAPEIKVIVTEGDGSHIL